MPQGFIVTDHWGGFRDYRARALAGLRSGELISVETETRGLESAPEAFRELFVGGSVGKLIATLR